MDAEHLLKMAQQISQVFEALHDEAEAVAGIAQHIERFWAPRMQHALWAHLDAHPDAAMSPRLRAALQRLRASHPVAG